MLMEIQQLFCILPLTQILVEIFQPLYHHHISITTAQFADKTGNHQHWQSQNALPYCLKEKLKIVCVMFMTLIRGPNSFPFFD